MGAVAGSVAVLVSLQSQGEDLWVGVCNIVQTCLTLAAGMICWCFSTGEGSGDGYYAI